MKIRRIAIVTAALMILTALSGCKNDSASSGAVGESFSSAEEDSAAEEVSSPESGSKAESTIASTESLPEESVVEENTMLTGLEGDVIKLSEITSVSTDNGESGGAELYSDESFTNNDVMIVTCDGFGYIAESSQPCFNSIDNADAFNSATGKFTGSTDEEMKNFKRVSVGDTVGNFTVTSAKSTFASSSMIVDKSDTMSIMKEHPEIFFASSDITLSGEFSMTGYICQVLEDEYAIAAGDIIFVPSESCSIPVMSFTYADQLKGICHKTITSMRNDFYWNNEYGDMVIANINDLTCDTSAIPSDGSFAKVKVTADSVNLFSNSIRILNNIKLNVTSIEAL